MSKNVPNPSLGFCCESITAGTRKKWCGFWRCYCFIYHFHIREKIPGKLIKLVWFILINSVLSQWANGKIIFYITYQTVTINHFYTKHKHKNINIIYFPIQTLWKKDAHLHFAMFLCTQCEPITRRNLTVLLEMFCFKCLLYNK